MTIKRPEAKRSIGWRLPLSLIARLNEYAEQRGVSATVVAIALLEQGLKNAIKRGDYRPGGPSGE